jgi:hypothetical protein
MRQEALLISGFPFVREQTEELASAAVAMSSVASELVSLISEKAARSCAGRKTQVQVNVKLQVQSSSEDK